MAMTPGKTTRIPKNAQVDYHVRTLTYSHEGQEDQQFVEIREYIKPTSIFGHGIVIPLENVQSVANAMLTRIPGLAIVKDEQ